MKLACAVFALLLFALPVLAAIDGVDGNWSGTVSTPNGDFPLAFTFKTDAATLTGSMTGPDGSAMPIANGKMDGNNLTFSVDVNMNGNVFSLSYKGVLDGEQIKMTAEVQGQAFDFVVKKVK